MRSGRRRFIAALSASLCAGCLGREEGALDTATGETDTETTKSTTTETTRRTTAEGGPDSSTGPDLLVVIGYPRSGIQLFRDYYAVTDGQHDIVIPDGLRDGSLPGQVGNDMDNVFGTAPASDGPHRAAFTDRYREEYDEEPGVFTEQSYDAMATLILANAAAGENSGPAVRDQMRRIANPGGETFGPDRFVDAVEAAAAGENVDYRGASSEVNFDAAGDPASAAYSVWQFEGRDSSGISTIETTTVDGETPDGSGPAADEAPGGLGRTISVGGLLPRTGDLASIGEAMIRASALPIRQVNRSSVDLHVDGQLEDTGTSPDQGLEGARALVDAGVPAVCGAASSGVNVPVSDEIFAPNDVVGCSPSSTALSVTNLDDDDFIFRTAPSDLLQARAMALVAARRLNADTAATLYVNNDYGQRLSASFSEVFRREFGGDVRSQLSFNVGESSYESVIEAALSD